MQLKDVLEIREDIIVRVRDKYYCNQGMYCEIGSSFRLKVGEELIKLVNFIKKHPRKLGISMPR